MERWYHWNWDHAEADCPANFRIVRWRRGWLTFYCYQINLPGTSDQFTQWWIYIPGNFGFGINLPAWIANRFEWAHREWTDSAPSVSE